MAYLDLGLGTFTAGERYVDRVEIPVPAELRNAPHGELLLSNNKPGSRVQFGRDDEDSSFGLNLEQRYISLRVYPQEKAPSPDWTFNPLYVRVDHDASVYFFCLKVRWEKNVITVEVERNSTREEVHEILLGA